MSVKLWVTHIVAFEARCSTFIMHSSQANMSNEKKAVALVYTSMCVCVLAWILFFFWCNICMNPIVFLWVLYLCKVSVYKNICCSWKYRRHTIKFLMMESSCPGVDSFTRIQPDFNISATLPAELAINDSSEKLAFHSIVSSSTEETNSWAFTKRAKFAYAFHKELRFIVWSDFE